MEREKIYKETKLVPGSDKAEIKDTPGTITAIGKTETCLISVYPGMSYNILVWCFTDFTAALTGKCVFQIMRGS